MAKVYVVDLTPDERAELLSLLRGGQTRVRKTNRARILLLAHEGRTDEEVAEALLTSVSTVERTRKRFVEGGLGSGLSTSRRVLEGSASSRASRKRTWWLWPVAILPRARRSAGACSCWPTDSWSLGSWRRSPTRQSGVRSKGGRQAVAEEAVVYPRGGSGVCVAHGGCARALRGAL